MADLKALVRRKASEKGLAEHWPVIERIIQLESSWNPNAHNTKGEDSVGLFQLNRAGGIGSGYSVKQLMNPETNAEIALSAIQGALKGGASIDQALRPWTTAAAALGGTQMAGETITAAGGAGQDDWIQRILQQVQALLEEGGAINVDAAGRLLQTIPSDMRAQIFGGVTAGAAEAPSPQEVAVSQQTLDIALANAQANIQKMGLEAAAKQFANDVTALQEGRATAEYAQEYAGKIAPPGMTTLPFTGPTSAVGQLQTQIGMTPSPAIPLRQAPVTDPYQALGQAQQFVPQAPNLQFQAPALPQPVNLAALSGFQQQMPVGGAALPIGGGGDFAARVASLREAMRMLFGQVGGMFHPGAQLPIGGG